MPDDSTQQDLSKDPRVYMAAERTFLAWIRTGLSLMGFGFVVARFGLFLREMQLAERQPSLRTPGWSLWFGTALVLVGVFINVAAVLLHVRIVNRIRAGVAFDRPAPMALALGLALGVVGLAMVIYLVSMR